MKSFLLILMPLFICCNNISANKFFIHNTTAVDSIDGDETRLILQTEKCRRFINRNHHYNQQFVFLVDMRIPSNRYRFFVVDLISGKAIYKGLVAHGVGSNAASNGEMKFSNQEGSYCSSLGMYRVDAWYNGRFGKSYRLTGLNNSNSHAIRRAIVLHQYDCVPYNEQSTPICNSLGCPMVSPAFFSQLEKFIDKSPKKILLGIYY